MPLRDMGCSSQGSLSAQVVLEHLYPVCYTKDNNNNSDDDDKAQLLMIVKRAEEAPDQQHIIRSQSKTALYYKHSVPAELS